MDAGIFVQAVDTLHSPTATPAQRVAANDWLVAFAAVAEAPSVCEAVLRWPGASAAALCFAANVVATSAAQLGAAAAMPLLQMCASVPSRAAAARLAQAAAEAIVRAGGEAAFFDEPLFAQLDTARKLLVLQCVAEALEQHASPEELQCRPNLNPNANATPNPTLTLPLTLSLTLTLTLTLTLSRTLSRTRSSSAARRPARRASGPGPYSSLGGWSIPRRHAAVVATVAASERWRQRRRRRWCFAAWRVGRRAASATVGSVNRTPRWWPRCQP